MDGLKGDEPPFRKPSPINKRKLSPTGCWLPGAVAAKQEPSERLISSPTYQPFGQSDVNVGSQADWDLALYLTVLLLLISNLLVFGCERTNRSL